MRAMWFESIFALPGNIGCGLYTRQVLMQIEDEAGELRTQFERQRERFAERCSDYGRKLVLMIKRSSRI